MGVLARMPLDAGAFAEESVQVAQPARRSRPRLDPALAIGPALKDARETLGLSLTQISEMTRVRVRHLEAIEADDLEGLPSRPFAIGYVRAYARALGLDADATAARFRAEHPSPDDDLHTPVGLAHQGRPRNRAAVALIGAAAVAILAWNIARHAVAAPPRRPPPVAAQPTVRAAAGPFTVEKPLPAPPEATAPAPYVTPVVGPNAPAAPVGGDPTASVTQQASDVGRFTPQGTIYGPAAGASPLVIQARKSISLEVRGPGGVVYFARELAAGEAYRVPALPGLTAEVSNPQSAELFEAGASKGLFPKAQLPLDVTG